MNLNRSYDENNKKKKRFLFLILLLIFTIIVPVQAADIVLLFDASYSMKDHPLDEIQKSKIELAREGVDTFLTSLSDEDRVALIVFYDCYDIRVESGFTQDKDLIRQTLSGVQPSGNTPIAGALEKGWTYIKQNGRDCEKWAIVLFTDGEETCDPSGCSVASSIASEGKQYSQTPVYIIAYDMPTIHSTAGYQNEIACIAQATGGSIKSPTTIELNTAFQQTAETISKDINKGADRCTAYQNLVPIGVVSIVLILIALIALIIEKK